MGEEILYDKLIRDKIPEIIKKEGKEYEIHQADKEEYIAKLLLKVEEELAENQCALISISVLIWKLKTF